MSMYMVLSTKRISKEPRLPKSIVACICLPSADWAPDAWIWL